MLPWFRKPKKPQTDEEILAEAFADVAKQQTKRSVRKRRATLWRKYADPRILAALGIICVALIADGVRRENQEFYATVAEATGTGQARVKQGADVQPLEAGLRLEDGGEVQTGANCRARLNFPDGSVITLAPNSHLKVELLEYSRGGMWRGRSFTLGFGQMWARVSPKFGEESRCRVHTPSSVAAVRGTRFYVAHDPSANATRISCNDGLVRVDGFRGRPSMVAGGATTAVTYGSTPERPQGIDPQTRGSFAQPALAEEIRPDSWLKRTELKLTSVLDLPLSMLGIGKSSWAIGAADFARRTNAMEALRLIHTAISGYPTYPEFVDPFTLRELDFRPEDALRILKSFDGRSIVQYRPSGTNNFVIYARARDRARTPFRLTAYGVEVVTEEEMAGL